MSTRPGTRSGTGAGPPSRKGLTTSSGRPRTSRPETATNDRPGTSSGRGNGGDLGAHRPATANLRQDQYIAEEDDMYDEDDYESEDEDVFAFVPPDVGPSAQTVQLSGNNVDIANGQQTQHSQRPEEQQQHLQQRQLREHEETLYFDEATGAVYDSQGRLVNMPTSYQPEAVFADSGSSAPSLVQRTSDVSIAVPQPARVSARDNAAAASLGRQPSDARRQDMPDYSRNNSYASSGYARDSDAPMIANARNVAGFPQPVDLVQELSSDGPPGSRTGSRNVGMTARGGLQLDEMGAETTSVLRHRSNRHHSFENGASTPMQELPYKFDSPTSEDDIDSKRALDFDAGTPRPPPVFDGIDDDDNKNLRMVELEMETEEDSPYPEVRASVSNIDDPDMPVSTFRAWFLCFVLGTLAGAINMLLNLRYPAPILSPIVMQLVAYPCGKLMAAVLPIRTIHMPRWLGGFSFSLNPGLFNIKEHALITIVMNQTIQQAYALYSTLCMNSPQFYNTPKPFLFSVLFVLSSQMIGFAFAGVSRRFLVWPASMIWPQNLVSATILNTLHAEDDEGDGTISRFRYFYIVFGAATIWYFVPGFLFQAVSLFGWLCWIWPNNFVVNTVFGPQSGLGLSVLTFDWNQINYLGSPLVYPWWSECNIFAGFVAWVCIFIPAIYFTNTLYTAYMPFNSPQSYDNQGQPYDVTRVVTKDNNLDVAAYEAYSPLFLPASYLMLYLTGFALATAVLTHTILYHGKALWRGVRYVKTEEDDIHAKYMRRYPEVPEWWYVALGLLMFALGVVAIEVYDTGMPVWALILSIVIPAVYVLPAGFIYAMTGSVIGTNLIGELVAGYAMPGDALANMIFKVYALEGLSSALSFVQDLKLGHYMKVPPRHSFAAQVIFAIWIVIVQIAVQEFMIAHVPTLCMPDQEHHFTCPHARVFFTSSIVWGIIGPKRLFGTGGLYTALYWAFLAGAVLPLPFWLLARKFPKSWVRFISVPIALNGATFVPPAGGLVYTSWFAVAFVFQYLIRRYNFRWWSKYNFVTSAALDSGTIVSTILIFLVLQLPKDGNIQLNWWGNTVFTNTIDYISPAWKQVPPGGFGPAPKA